MKHEDAFYYFNLLMIGFSDGYDEWLNDYLESEDPLSDIVLELACCGSNVNQTVSVLHHYCAGQPFDEAVLCDRLRLFLKEAYDSHRMTKEEIVSAMYRFAVDSGSRGDFDDLVRIWGSMYYLDDYHALAKNGIISWESFDFAFFSYLDNGTPLDSNLIWAKNIKRLI